MVTELHVQAGQQVALNQPLAVVTPQEEQLMIDFRLDEEHEALRKTVEEFAREVVAPVIGEFYERDEFPYDIVAEMGAHGPVRAAVPRGVRRHGRRLLRALHRAGGAGPGRLSVAITLEAGVSLGAMPIYRFGTEEQKREWLPRLCSGEMLGGVRADRAGRRLGRRARTRDHGAAGRTASG